MSESLTLEQLENELHYYYVNKENIDVIEKVFSMARRSLQLEERLGKAVEASKKANDSLSWLISRRFLVPEDNNVEFHKALVALKEVKEVVEGSSEGLRPPVPATPPVEPDALP